MGLDMYLERHSYVKNWNHMDPKDRHTIEVRCGGEIRGDIKPDRISSIVEEVGYWRKANQIHRWFVENVQDGKDDCKEYNVKRKQLEELLATCREVIDTVHLEDGKLHESTVYNSDGTRTENYVDGKVISNTEVCDRLLPTQSGFFFGGTGYNQWYLDDLHKTIEIIEAILKIPDDEDCGDYYYHSSW